LPFDLKFKDKDGKEKPALMGCYGIGLGRLMGSIVEIYRGGTLEFKGLIDSFDVAFCIEVSEYWWHPICALFNICGFLKKGGILYISFHFVYMQHAPKGTDFLRYTPDGAEKLLKEAGFEILEHKHRMAKSELLTMYYGCDKMRGIKDNSVNHNVIGSLIKAKKL